MKKFIATTIREYLNENIETCITWYHGSDYKFSSFENFKSSGSSALGIFVTSDKTLAELFGDNVYEVEIKYNNSYNITMDKWDDIRSKYVKDTIFFQNMKNYLIGKGYDSVFIKSRQWKSSGGVSFNDGNIVVLFDKSQLSIIKALP